jgi:PPOX class probable F420-dependent enzyme
MVRKDISMTDTEILEFLTEGSKVLQVATIGKDGMPHLAPMWYVMDGDRIVFRSFTKSQKIVNLMRDPRLSVLAEEGDSYAELRGLSIRADAELIVDPSYIVETYRKLTAKYAFFDDGPTEVPAEAAEATFGPFAPKNTAVIVNPITTASWDHRKLGGSY